MDYTYNLPSIGLVKVTVIHVSFIFDNVLFEYYRAISKHGSSQGQTELEALNNLLSIFVSNDVSYAK